VSLKADIGSTVVSRGIYVASQWLLMVVVARYAGADQLGEFAYALAVCGPVIILAQLNMRAFMATDASQQFGFASYFSTQVVTQLVAMVLIVLIAVKTLSAGGPILLVILVGLYKAIESISGVYYGALQRNKQMWKISISVAMHGMAALFVMTAVLLSTGSIIYAVSGIFVAWSLILLFYDARMKSRFVAEYIKNSGNNDRQDGIVNVLAACFPLGIVVAMLSLRMNIPVYFIQSEMVSEQVGFYSAYSIFRRCWKSDHWIDASGSGALSGEFPS